MGYLLALGILLSTAMPFLKSQMQNINQQSNVKIIMASAQSNLGETPSFIKKIMNMNSNNNNSNNKNKILIIPSIMKHRNHWYYNWYYNW